MWGSVFWTGREAKGTGLSIESDPTSVPVALAMKKSPPLRKFARRANGAMRLVRSVLTRPLLALILLIASGCSQSALDRRREQAHKAPWPYDDLGGFYDSERVAAAKREGYTPKNIFDLAPFEVESLEERARAGDKKSAKRLRAFYLMAGYDESKAIYFKQLSED